MKYLVLSDIHGIMEYAKEIPNIVNREKPEKIILLGDLYYHGYDKKRYKESMEITNLLNSYKDHILCTKGNCDTDIDIAISEFKIEDYIKLNINNKTFFFTHGHKYDVESVYNNIDVFIFGHLHTGFIRKYKNILYVNSGSLSLPRNNTHNSYLIIDNENIILKDISGNDIDKCLYI